ncbi:PnuC-like nicotinamide riboside transporter [Microbacterium phage Cece]|nr:PnuC-like nicotinamide riboside transporter [Microbacterium phage Cece]
MTKIIKNDFLVAAIIAVALSGLTFALAYSLGWLTEAPNWFEVAGATINYGATYLSIKQRRFTYVLGFVASGAFAIAYFQYGLLASALLSAYLVGQLVYGYFRWGPDGAARPVHKFQWKWAWAYALATVLTYFGAVGVVTLFGGQFAFWDAAILILTILAQFLLDNKVLAAWYVWGAVNIVGMTLYFTAGAPFAAMQQLIFFFANIPGFILWKQTMDAAGTHTLEDGPEAVDLTARGLGKGYAAKESLAYSGDSKADAAFHGKTDDERA